MRDFADWPTEELIERVTQWRKPEYPITKPQRTTNRNDGSERQSLKVRIGFVAHYYSAITACFVFGVPIAIGVGLSVLFCCMDLTGLALFAFVLPWLGLTILLSSIAAECEAGLPANLKGFTREQLDKMFH